MEDKKPKQKVDPSEFPFKPLSAKEFLEFMPIDMTDEEKEEFANEMEEHQKNRKKAAR